MVSHKPLSVAQQLLAKHKISISMVSRSAGVKSEHAVASILNPASDGQHLYKKVMAVRAAVERLLTAMGEEVNSETLWQEYDQEAAA